MPSLTINNHYTKGIIVHPAKFADICVENNLFTYPETYRWITQTVRGHYVVFCEHPGML